MNPKSIWLIAPHIGLAEVAQQVCEEQGFDIEVRVGNMYQAVEITRQAVKHGAEVVISRGGTAVFLRQHVEIPVVEIFNTGFDLLRVLYPLKDFGKNIAVVGYKNVIYGSKEMGEILGLIIHEETIERNVDIPKKIQELMEQGFSVILGDTDVVKAAQSAGLEAKLVSSGKGAILSAIKEALNIRLVTQMEQAKAKELKTIVDNVQEGIISVNAEGIITVFNVAAEKMLQEDMFQVIGKKLVSIIPQFKKGFSQKQVVDFKGKELFFNAFPIMLDQKEVGSIITLQQVSDLRRHEEQVRRETYTKGLIAHKTFEDIIGKSSALSEAVSRAKTYSQVDSTILLVGESGTGKELFAQGIHNYSSRKNGPFVAVNCAALPENLLESELFGYEKGAFTGALHKGKIGFFELAHGGTIFLDEIAEIPLGIQAKLLRAIQEREVLRLGANSIVPIDVRIIAATNKDLEDMVNEGFFREDLYYRLSVLKLKIPPLRDRNEDIMDLVLHFTKAFTKKYNRYPVEYTDDATKELTNYSWKGNVREVENFVERAILKYEGRVVEAKSIFELLGKDKKDNSLGFELDSMVSLEDLERDYIHYLVKKGFGKSQIAETLGISRVTLWRKIRDQYTCQDN